MSLLADLVARPLGPPLDECRDFDPGLATALARAMVPGEPPANVVFGAFHPSANVVDRVIRLPDPRGLDDAARERAAPFLRGFLYHELGHLGSSGPGLFAALHGEAPTGPETMAIAAAIAHQRRWGARFTGLAVAVEDVRVDRWVLETFQGARAFMLACYRVIADLDGDPAAGLAQGGALERLCGAVLHVGRYVLPIAELPSPTRDLVMELGRTFEKALAARSDLEVVEATAAVLLALEGLAADADRDDARGRAAMTALDVLTEPSPQVRGGCLHDDRAIRKLVDEIIAHAPPSSAPAPSPAAPRTTAGPPMTTTAVSTRSPAAHGSPSSAASKTHGGSSIFGTSASRRRRKPLATYRVLTKDFDEVVRYSADDRRAFAAAYDELGALARGSCAPLIDEVADLLCGEATIDLAVGARSGFTIDPAAFPAIVAGAAATDVWIRPVRTTAAAGNAAVLLLVDCSGSMGTLAFGGRTPSRACRPVSSRHAKLGTRVSDSAPETRSRIASIAITALHLALAPAQIPHAVVGYTSVPDVLALQQLAITRARAGEDLDAYARTVTAARHLLFKPFDQEDASAIAAIAPGALNLDGEAVAFGLDMLRQRDEALKLLVVLTDGEPSNIRDGSIELHHLRQTVARAGTEGVRCIGVGVASQAVHDSYREHIVVDDLTTLAPALLGLIRRVVLTT